MKLKSLLIILIISTVFSCSEKNHKSLKPTSAHNLIFNELATVWDEAMPLGNGMVGNLVWQKDGNLRFSLDRADLWDLRPMENIDFNKWKFKDVYEFWKNDKYIEVQKAFDVPYDQSPAPSKIPAGALEFDISNLGKVKQVSLDVETAVCTVEWENGAKLTTFVHGLNPVGWYKFENLPETINIELIAPAYNRESSNERADQSTGELNQLGYPQGEIVKGKNSFTYNQKGWGSFSYQIHTELER